MLACHPYDLTRDKGKNCGGDVLLRGDRFCGGTQGLCGDSKPTFISKSLFEKRERLHQQSNARERSKYCFRSTKTKFGVTAQIFSLMLMVRYFHQSARGRAM